MTTLANQILVKGNPQLEEYIANAALSPGHLVEVLSSGKIQKHATVSGKAERLVAKEDDLTGPGVFRNATGQTADTAYAALDLVPVLVCTPGTVVTMLLKAGANYAVGDKLVSAGDGTLEKTSAIGSANVPNDFAVVYDALDLTGSGAVAKRTAVRLL